MVTLDRLRGQFRRLSDRNQRITVVAGLLTLFIIGLFIALMVASMRNAPTEQDKMVELEHGARVLLTQDIGQIDYGWKPDPDKSGLLWQNELNRASAIRQRIKKEIKTKGTKCYDSLAIRTIDACADLKTIEAFQKLGRAIAISDDSVVEVRLSKRDRVALSLLQIIANDLARYEETAFAIELNPSELLRRWSALAELRFGRQVDDSASFEELSQQLIESLGK